MIDIKLWGFGAIRQKEGHVEVDGDRKFVEKLHSVIIERFVFDYQDLLAKGREK